jgi:hypothetical protein
VIRTSILLFYWLTDQLSNFSFKGDQFVEESHLNKFRTYIVGSFMGPGMESKALALMLRRN